MKWIWNCTRREIDRGKQVTYEAELSSLRDGTFVHVDGWAHLVWCHALLPWTPDGYARKHRSQDSVVTVLTAETVVECFREEYVPEIHSSWHSL